MGEWVEYKLEDFAEINPTERLAKGALAKKIAMEVLQPFTKQVSSFSVEAYNGGMKFKNGDTIMARITPSLENGKTSYIDILEQDEIAYGSTEFIVFRERENISDKQFIYYLTTSPIIRNTAIKSMTGSSGRQRVQTDVIKEHLIDVPSLPEQKAIAEVLSSLDAKIDMLHRQNTTLEQMAETLFRQWFVEEAKEDWEIVKVGDFVTTNKKSVSKNYPHRLIQYLDTGSLTEGRIESIQELNFEEAPSRAKRLTMHNDILISTVRPNQKHYGIIKNPIENLVVSTGFCVITCENIDPYFIYIMLTTSEMTEYLHSIAEGSTSTYPSLKPNDIEALKFQLPPKELLKDFSEYCNSAWNKIDVNQNQIRTIEKMRDTLLPKLMGGEVKVSIDG